MVCVLKCGVWLVALGSRVGKHVAECEYKAELAFLAVDGKLLC